MVLTVTEADAQTGGMERRTLGAPTARIDVLTGAARRKRRSLTQNNN